MKKVLVWMLLVTLLVLSLSGCKQKKGNAVVMPEAIAVRASRTAMLFLHSFMKITPPKVICFLPALKRHRPGAKGFIWIEKIRQLFSALPARLPGGFGEAGG